MLRYRQSPGSPEARLRKNTDTIADGVRCFRFNPFKIILETNFGTISICSDRQLDFPGKVVAISNLAESTENNFLHHRLYVVLKSAHRRRALNDRRQSYFLQREPGKHQISYLGKHLFKSAYSRSVIRINERGEHVIPLSFCTSDSLFDCNQVLHLHILRVSGDVQPPALFETLL